VRSARGFGRWALYPGGCGPSRRSVPCPPVLAASNLCTGGIVPTACRGGCGHPHDRRPDGPGASLSDGSVAAGARTARSTLPSGPGRRGHSRRPTDVSVRPAHRRPRAVGRSASVAAAARAEPRPCRSPGELLRAPRVGPPQRPAFRPARKRTAQRTSWAGRHRRAPDGCMKIRS
jgi:hypothetical protein